MREFYILSACIIAAILIFGTISLQQTSASEIIIEKGKNYDKTLIYDTTNLVWNGVWKSHSDRIFDPNKQEYVDYIYSETVNVTQIETAQVSYVYSKLDCSISIFEAGKINQNSDAILKSESWNFKYAPGNSNNWKSTSFDSEECTTNVIQNSTGVYIEGTKADSLGHGKVMYAKPNGKPLETFSEILNNDNTKNNHKFGFDQNLVLNNSVFTHDPAKKLLKFNTTSDDLVLDYYKGKDQFWTVNQNGKNVHLDFKNATENLPPGQAKKLDPTFQQSPSDDNAYYSGFDVSSVCVVTVDASQASLAVHIGQNDAAERCYVVTLEFDTTTIPDSATVTDSIIEYDTTTSDASSRDCAWVHITNQPSTATDQQNYDDATDGTTYVAADTNCSDGATSSNYQVDLGATFDSDLETALSGAQDWIGLGVAMTPFTRDADVHGSTVFDNVELIVNYQVGNANAGPPVNVQAVGLNGSIGVSWTPQNATAVTEYTVWNSTTGIDTATYDDLVTTGQNNTFFITHNLTYPGEQGSYMVSAVSANNGTNSTATSLVAADSAPSTPTSLTTQVIGSTGIGLNWTAADDGNDPIINYTARCEINNSGGWINPCALSYFNPISYHKLDAHLRDSTGDNDGTVTSTQNFTVNSEYEGLAFWFDGDESIALDGDTEANYDFDVSSTFSSAFVINASVSDKQTLISKRNGGAEGWEDIIATTGEFQFNLENIPATNIQINTIATINNAKTQHIIRTYDGSRSASGVNIYINGTAQGTTTIIDTLTTTTALNNLELTIGARPAIARPLLAGFIDEVQIYDFELTQTDVNNIYSNHSPPTRANHTGLSSGDDITYQIQAFNDVGGSGWSGNVSATTHETPQITVVLFTNQTGDAVQIRPTVTLTNGSPAPTLDTVVLLRNGTAINTTLPGVTLAIDDTWTVNNFNGQLVSPNVYNYTVTATTTNTQGSSTNSSSTFLTPEYTASYFTSTAGGFQVNYTHARNNDGSTLNLVVNRQDMPGNIDCNWKNELFGDGEWFNQTADMGWYNLTGSVPTTRTIYGTCYNDDILFTFQSFGLTNATLALVDFSEELGTFLGVPIPFFFAVLVAALFTGRSAPTGIILVAIVVGMMGIMGYFPDADENPILSATTWGMLVFITAIGIFMGKRFF